MEEETVNNPNTSSDNDTQTVGDILRHARLKQGKTLNDVAEVLCIRRVYLEAIENVEYKKLPVEPYGLGYVRNYADYLGLNSARIVQSFKETAMPKVNGKKNLKAVGEDLSENGPHLGHVVLGILILFAALLGWNFYNKYSNEPSVEIVNETPLAESYPTPVILEDDEDEVEVSATEQEIVIEQPEENQNEVVDENEENVEETQDEKTPTEENLPRLKIVVIGDSWIELKHGKEVLLAKVYHKGFEYEVPYNDNLEVSVGKRNNVKFYIDGKLTEVTAPRRQMRIKLDKFLEKR